MAEFTLAGVLSSNKTKRKLEYIMKIKQEVMLFTLEMQSSRKLSSNGALLNIE